MRVKFVETVDDAPAWPTPEPQGYGNILFRDVLAFLDKRERLIVLSLGTGRTVSEMAGEAGHRDHTTISKRLKSIKEKARRLLRQRSGPRRRMPVPTATSTWPYWFRTAEPGVADHNYGAEQYSTQALSYGHGSEGALVCALFASERVLARGCPLGDDPLACAWGSDVPSSLCPNVASAAWGRRGSSLAGFGHQLMGEAGRFG